MAWKAWLAGSGLMLSVALACSGNEDKKASRDAGGAGGDATEPSAGGSQAPGEGGSGGSATAAAGGEGGSGAVLGEAGTGGTAASDAGAGGGPGVSIDLAALQGNWTGQIISSYVCESAPRDIELTIEGSSVTSTFPSDEDLGTGEILHQSGQSFTFGLFIDNPSFDQNYLAQLFVDPTASYALIVALAQHDDGPANSINIGLLQKSDLTPPAVVASDFVGTWNGPSFALDADLAIARELDATATFTDESDGAVTGQDDDGPFSGVFSPVSLVGNTWALDQMTQPPNALGALFMLSNDKQAMAVAMLRELDPQDGALCDLSEPFADMSVHKFGLWLQAAE